MLAQSTSVLGTIPEALLAEGPHKPAHLTVHLEGALGTNLTIRLEGGHAAVRGRHCTDVTEKKVGGEGRKTRSLPSILSEKTVLKITKSLSNPFLFFSHFLEVFQEFWSERGRTFSRKLSYIWIVINLMNVQLHRVCKQGEKFRNAKSRWGSWGSAEMDVFYSLTAAMAFGAPARRPLLRNF